MSVKWGTSEVNNDVVLRDPHDKVKAILPEIQSRTESWARRHVDYRRRHPVLTPHVGGIGSIRWNHSKPAGWGPDNKSGNRDEWMT